MRYYPLEDNLDRCVRSCNTLNDRFKKICVSNKAEGLHLSVCNMITGINESETLAKHISRKCKCKFDSRKYNPNQKWIKINVGASVKIKKTLCVKSIIFGILSQIVEKAVNM